MLARLLFATVLCCSSAEAFQSAGFLFPYKGMSVSVRTGISRQFSISNVRSVRARGPRCEQSAESNVQRLPGSRLNRGYSFAAIAWSAACIIRIISPLPWAASPAEKAVSVLAFTIYPLFLFAINALMKAAEKSIQNGGKGKGTLASDTYKRLNLSLFGFVRQLVSPFLCLRPITISWKRQQPPPLRFTAQGLQLQELQCSAPHTHAHPSGLPSQVWNFGGAYPRVVVAQRRCATRCHLAGYDL